MTLGELIQHVRKHMLRDVEKPYLWPDDLLRAFLNEAQDQFARRTHCLIDEESSFTVLETEVGERVYRLDPRVVFLYAIYNDDGRPLRDGPRRQMPIQPGEAKPTAFTCDTSTGRLRLYPAPDAVYTLYLRVARKPLQPLVNDDDVPEINEEYHLALCDWVVYRALRNNDIEAVQMTPADTFRASWELSVRDAKRDVVRMNAGHSARVLTNWTKKVR